MNLRQFKLTNSDEIVAEIMEIAEEGDLVIRNVLKIFHAEDQNAGIRYYSFKPWLSFQDNLEEITVLNIGHIIGETQPSKELISHYSQAMYQIHQYTNNNRKKDLNVDELERETVGMDDDELYEYMQQKLQSLVTKEETMLDSESQNVIQFRPSKDKLH